MTANNALAGTKRLTLLTLGHESTGVFGEAVSPKLGGVLGEAGLMEVYDE